MPSPPPTRSIVHLDADAFFASLEQRHDPALRGRPVAVGTGVVASCSCEARRFGVRTGMRLAEARRLCRSLAVLPGEYSRYERAARQIRAICDEHAPLVEQAALDDLYLDLMRPLGPDADQTVRRLKEAIRDQVFLSVSVGVGGNKLTARVATRAAKPGRVVYVPPGGERPYLAPWPVHVLPGAGGKIGGRLERINVRRVGQAAEVPAAVLHGLFGRPGLRLHEFARGIDPRPVEPDRPRRSVGRSTSFDPPVSDLSFLRAMLSHLLARACSWMRFHRLATRGLTLTIRYGDYATAAGREGFRRPVADENALLEAARDRFGRLYTRRSPLRSLGVELSPLEATWREAELFPDPEAERRRRLEEARDAIRRRFGFTSLLTGETLQLAARLDRDRDEFRLRTPCLTR